MVLTGVLHQSEKAGRPTHRIKFKPTPRRESNVLSAFASSETVDAFRFLRQPSRPNAPRPVAALFAFSLLLKVFGFYRKDEMVPTWPAKLMENVVDMLFDGLLRHA